MSDPSLILPPDVQTVLVTGAGGFVGRKLVQLLLSLYPKLKIITTDIVPPPSHDITDTSRLVSVKADLGNVKSVQALFQGETVGGVFALHGIMSGGSEANFELGYAVNIDAHVNLLKTTHEHAKITGTKPVYVFASSLAVYGGPKCTPQSFVIPKDTPPLAQTSYGVQKQIVELYCYDYGRKGYIDTRAVRLPTVVVRSGAPSSAASSFMSGLVREPLTGQIAECPIASSMDDPILDNAPVWVSRTKTVVRNIVYAMCMPEKNFEVINGARSVNLPGISITTRQIIDALATHGGKDKLDLIKFKPDPAVINICLTWPGNFDNSDAVQMGFVEDDPKTGFASAVRDFIEELGGAK